MAPVSAAFWSMFAASASARPRKLVSVVASSARFAEAAANGWLPRIETLSESASDWALLAAVSRTASASVSVVLDVASVSPAWSTVSASDDIEPDRRSRAAASRT